MEKTKSEQEVETLSYGEAQVNLIRANIFKKRTVNSPYKRWMKCTHCLSMFSTKASLTRHLKRFNCKETSRELNSLSYLSLSEIKEAIYGSKFKKKMEEKNAVPVIHEAVQMQSHLTQSEAEKQENQSEQDTLLNCELCSKTFLQKRTLNAHMKTHQKQNYLCPICGKQFAYKSSLASHQIVHQDPAKSYTCNQCDAAFTTIRSLRRHYYSHYNYGEKEFICELCGKRFAYSMTLKNHKLSHSEERPHVCRICGTSFKRTTHLRTHEQGVHGLHDGALPKNYTCAICQKSMVRKESLEAHMKEHTGELNFQCNNCHKKFATNTGLNIHVAMGRCHPFVKKCDVCAKDGENSVCEHLKPKRQKRREVQLKQLEEKEKFPGKKNPTLRHLKERNYFCKICGKNYVYPCELKTHFRLAHTDEKPFVCGRCGRSFKTKASLQMHEDVHNDLRPYKCDICQKRFRKTEHVKLHIRTHTGEKPHVCDICGRGFSQKGDMKKHILKTHNQSVPQVEKNTSPDGRLSAEIKEESVEIKYEYDVDLDVKEESFVCEICKESYSNETSLKKHVKNAHSSSKIKCNACDKEILKRSYKRHAKNVHGKVSPKNKKGVKDADAEDSTEEDKSDEQDAVGPCEIFCNVEINEGSVKNLNLLFKGVECKICNQRYSNKINLKKHVYNVHKMTRVKCSICDKEVNKKSLDRHMKSVHCAKSDVKKEKKPYTDEEKIPCILCDKKCLSVTSLQNHIKNIHEADQYKCPHCEFQGIRRLLEKHIKKEHNNEVFQCPKCQKILKSKSTLKEHMWIHTDHRRFICDICGMRFKRTSNYHGHLKSHQEKKFQCQLCGNFFLRKRYLAIHEQTIHNYYGEGVPPKEKGYQCEVCGVKLKWKNNLMAHMRIHTGEKPYKCKICGDDFTCHGSLRTHMAKHAICSTPSEVSSMFIQQAYLENRAEPLVPFPTSVIVSSSSATNKC